LAINKGEKIKFLLAVLMNRGEQMDTATPTGEMIFTVLGAVAELERSLIAERLRAGLHNARGASDSGGHPRR
jgi:DNA invertase Pin-like site-specific DNA recombinase